MPSILIFAAATGMAKLADLSAYEARVKVLIRSPGARIAIVATQFP